MLWHKGLPRLYRSASAGFGNLVTMCGIICVVSRPSARPLPLAADILDALDRAIAVAAQGNVAEAGRLVAQADIALRGEAGLGTLIDNITLVSGLISRVDQLDALASDA